MTKEGTQWKWDTKDSVSLDLANGDHLLVNRQGPHDPCWRVHLCVRRPDGLFHFKYRGAHTNLKVAQAEALRCAHPQ